MSAEASKNADERAFALVAKLTVAAAWLVPAMALLIASRLAVQISEPVGRTILDFWKEDGLPLIVVSTIGGGTLGGWMIWRARRRPSIVMGLALAASLPALVSPVHLWLEARRMSLALVATDLRPTVSAMHTFRALVVGFSGQLMSAILALALAGALATLYRRTVRGRTIIGLAMLPLVSLFAAYSVWSVRQTHLYKYSSYLAAVPVEEKLRALGIAADEVAWSVPAAIVAALSSVALLVWAARAVKLSAGEARRLFAPAALAGAAFVLNVALPRQTIVAGARQLASSWRPEASFDFAGSGLRAPSLLIGSGHIFDLRDATAAPLSDEQLTAWYARVSADRASSEADAVAIGIATDAAPDALRRVLGVIAAATPIDEIVAVTLVSRHDPGVVRSPGEFAMMSELWRQRTFRSVPLGVTGKGTCAEGCELFTAEGDALVVKSERWTVSEPPPWVQARTPADPLLLRSDQALAPARLVKLAAAAVAHDRLLTVVPPAPP